MKQKLITIAMLVMFGGGFCFAQTNTPTPTNTPTNTPTANDNCTAVPTVASGWCINSSTIGMKNDYVSNQFSDGHFGAADALYKIVLSVPSTLTVIGNASYDADWSLTNACDTSTSSVFSVDSSSTVATPSCTLITTPHPRGNLYESRALAAGSYYLWIDGNGYQAGSFSASVSWVTATPTPTGSHTVTPTSTAVPATSTPTPTKTPTDTPTVTPTNTPECQATDAAETCTPVPNTPTPVPATNTPTVTPTPTNTATPGCSAIGCQGTGTVGTQSTYLIAPAARSLVRIYNGGNETIYLGLGQPAVVGTGIGIPSSTAWESTGSHVYRGAIYAISSGGSDTVAIYTR